MKETLMRIVLNPRCLLAALVATLVFNGCGRSGGPGEQAQPLRLAVVTNNSSDWWTIARKGGEKAASELPGVSLDFRLLAEGTAAAQKALVDDLLARGVDGIAVSPLDVENQRQMLDEGASKTLLFTLGADAPASRRVCYAGTDDVASGRMAGELVKRALPDGGKIMVFVGRRDAQNAIDRFDGLKQGLEGSGVEVVDVRTDDVDATKAKTNAADTLVRYPDIDGLVGLWSYNGPAILSAVADAGKLGKVRIVTFDEADETLQGVKDGHIYGTVVQQPYGFTYEAVKRMALYLRGDKSQIPADGKLVYPTEVIRRDNVDEFRAKLKELRGR
jgi:ribose transport system substrate-binding protein